MRNLFLRIFSVLILAVVLSFAIGFMISPWLRPIHKESGKPTPFPSSNVSVNENESRPHGGFGLRDDIALEIRWIMQSAQDTLDKNGYERFLQALTIQNQSQFMEFYLLTFDGEPVAGPEIPEDIKELVTEHPADDHQGLLGETGSHLVYYYQIRNPEDGKPIVYIGTFYRHPRPLHRHFWSWPNMLRPLSMLLCIALACYLLARQISQPASLLRATVRQFAEGDLDARVSKKILKRKDELGELAREFDHMADRINDLIDAQQRLLEDVSHELRTPLARQTIAIELLRQKLEPGDLQDLERIEREASRLEFLIGELLSLSRLESNTETVIPSRIELETLLQDIVRDADYEARSQARSVRLVQSTPCSLLGSKELIARGIENIIRNAIRYTAENTTVEVSLARTREDSACLLTIRDHGPGIPEDTIEEIFKPFYRVEKSRDRQTGGTGLGLAIAERAIRRHNGKIQAQNHSEGGLEVIIRLPVENKA